MPNDSVARRRALCALAAPLIVGHALVATLASVPAYAQGTDWQPFREQDQRASRSRTVAPLPPALPPMQGGGLDHPQGPPVQGPATYGGATPSGGPSPLGQPSARPQTVESGQPKIERIELAPIEGARPVSAGQVGPMPAVSGPLGASSAPGQPQTRSRASSEGLVRDVWRGVDLKGLETLIGPLEIPPRSAALHMLWTRLLTTEATPPSGGQGAGHFAALWLEALYRSGLTGAMGERLARSRANPDDPLVMAFTIRHALVDGASAKACEDTRRLAAMRDRLPKLLKGEVHVLSGYCAAIQGNPRGAGLAAELAREDEVEAPFALEVLDSIGTGQPAAGRTGAKLNYPKRLTVLEYRLLELLAPPDPQAILGRAEPALLSAIANAENADVRLTLAAAEAAASVHALAPEGLAEVYRAVTLPAAAGSDVFFRRAMWFKSLLAEEDAGRKVQLARQLLDDARRSGAGLVMARALALPLEGVRSAGEMGYSALTLIEVALAAGDYPRARQLASAQPEAQAWLALVDIADPRTQGVSDGALAAVDGLARQGRFELAVLHRLATVLDALDVNVPIPLWEAANRTPQPTSGYLPETGTLPQLQEAARKGEVGRTALLAMRTIGPEGPDKAHLVGLGDAIRALRRVGLEGDARALALEALYADWPRLR